MSEDNKKLGEFVITGLKSAPRGEVQAEVTFELDENGILNASAVEVNGPNKESITLNIHKDYYTQEQIDKIVAQAEQFREEDEKKKTYALVKIDLQDFCYSSINKIKRMQSISNMDKTTAIKTCEDALEWISGNQIMSNTEIENVKQRVSKTCNDIFYKIDTCKETSNF